MTRPSWQYTNWLNRRDAGMRPVTDKLIVTFPTTVAAMALEAACAQDGTPGRLIPVPTQISAGCGMCWCADYADEDAVMETIASHGLLMQEIHRL